MAIKIGSRCSDVIDGTSGSDLIIARKGSDTVYGGDGDDWIFGGKGSDTLYGGDGDDWLFGGQGSDELYGEAGDDWLFGGQGQDVLVGGTGDDVMAGGQGDDIIDMGTGADVGLGGRGDDAFHYSVTNNAGSDATDHVDGGRGSDTLVLHMTQGEETLYRGAIEEALSTHRPWETFDFSEVTDGAINLKMRSIENIVIEVEGNDAPVAGDDNFSVLEDNHLVINPADLIVNDSDPDGSLDASKVVVMTAASHGTIAVGADGVITYVADPDYNGADSFTYTVEDEVGATSNIATVNINVVAVNDAPEAISLSNAAITENAAGVVVGALSVADPDAGDTHTFIVNDSRFEVVDGNLQLKEGVSLDHEQSPTVAVEVTATDAGGLSVSQVFTVEVTNVNEAPEVISLDGNVISENAAGAVVGALSVADPDAGDTHTFIVNDSRFEVVDGNLQLKEGVSLDHEQSPTVAVEVTAIDAGGLSVSQTFNIEVTDVNDTPISVVIDDASAAEGDPVVFTVTLSEAPAEGETVIINYNTVALTATEGSGEVIVDPGDDEGIIVDPGDDDEGIIVDPGDDSIIVDPGLDSGDYVTTAGTLTFTHDGSLIQTISVITNSDDDVAESSETFEVHISSSSANVVVVDGVGLGTITNVSGIEDDLTDPGTGDDEGIIVDPGDGSMGTIDPSEGLIDDGSGDPTDITGI